jgi:hypothetical protein
MKYFAFYIFSKLNFSEDHVTLYRLIFEKPGTPQPLKKFVPSYEKCSFITAYTKLTTGPYPKSNEFGPQPDYLVS